MAAVVGTLTIAPGATGFFEKTGLPFRPTDIQGRHQSSGANPLGGFTPSYAWCANENEEGSVFVDSNGVVAATAAADEMINTEDDAANTCIGTFQSFLDDGFQINISTNTLGAELIISFLASRE